MSEQFKPPVEQGPEQLPKPEHQEHEPTHEQRHDGQEHAEKDAIAESLDALRREVDSQAISGKERPVHGGEQSYSDQPISLQRDLKADAYRQTLKRTQDRLPALSRTFSKIAHQPAIEAVSNVAAKTVARPSGLLAGSLAALLGSAFLLYMTKHYGFSYNYALFFLCFISGFVVGMIIEALWKLLTRRNSNV